MFCQKLLLHFGFEGFDNKGNHIFYGRYLIESQYTAIKGKEIETVEVTASTLPNWADNLHPDFTALGSPSWTAICSPNWKRILSGMSTPQEQLLVAILGAPAYILRPQMDIIISLQDKNAALVFFFNLYHAVCFP